MTRSKRGKKRERNITTTSSMCFKLISYAKDVFKILLNSFFTELGQLNNTQLNIMSQSHVMCRFKKKKNITSWGSCLNWCSIFNSHPFVKLFSCRSCLLIRICIGIIACSTSTTIKRSNSPIWIILSFVF